jgi:hypothetical protein
VTHRIATYARVSTLHSQNPEMQLAELREYASRRGWEITAEYVDLGVSGSRESRPAEDSLAVGRDAEAFRFQHHHHGRQATVGEGELAVGLHLVFRNDGLHRLGEKTTS